MRSSLLVALGFAAASATASPVEIESIDFAAYQQRYGKAYASPVELESRRALFEAAKAEVIAHNAEYDAGIHTWYKDLTEFADYTEAEFASLRSTYTSRSKFPTVAALRSEGANPDEVDWRTKGATTPVKNQGGCGSCWSFSATETIESHYFIASGELVELAPQTFVNCVKNPDGCGGTGGCEGATMELAFNLTTTTGVALESDLPYKGSDETCTDYKPAVVATGYVKNPENDALGLETALAKTGPQSVTVAADAWQLYGGGIFTGCSKGGIFRKGDNTLDHGVQAVGYTKDYWIVRNSWGSSWGEKGFIRLGRAADNKTFTDSSPADGVACQTDMPKSQTVGGECGILFDTSYPTGVKAA